MAGSESAPFAGRLGACLSIGTALEFASASMALMSVQMQSRLIHAANQPSAAGCRRPACTSSTATSAVVAAGRLGGTCTTTPPLYPRARDPQTSEKFPAHCSPIPPKFRAASSHLVNFIDNPSPADKIDNDGQGSPREDRPRRRPQQRLRTSRSLTSWRISAPLPPPRGGRPPESRRWTLTSDCFV